MSRLRRRHCARVGAMILAAMADAEYAIEIGGYGGPEQPVRRAARRAPPDAAHGCSLKARDCAGEAPRGQSANARRASADPGAARSQ